MKNILKIVAVAAVAVALTQTVQAVQIVGNIGFHGDAVLNGTTVGSATGVTSWNNVVVGLDSGNFTSIPVNTAVTLFSPWSFNSGVVNNFWTVGGFTFNLSSSSVFSNAGGFLNVVIAGTVSGNGFTATPFNGTFQVADPASNGSTSFTARLSFNSVPDGGTTVLLLGAALSGLALMKRKFMA
jgi:hypothetical protein